MNDITKPRNVSDFPNKQVFKLASEKLVDNAKVQLGGLSPILLKAPIADKGKVRLGGLGPIFRV